MTWHAEQLAHISDVAGARALNRRLVLSIKGDVAEVQQSGDQPHQLLMQ